MASGSSDGDMGGSLNLLGKLETEEAERFVHRAINDLCEKAGLQYEDYPKLLSLTDYSTLKHSLRGTIRSLSRDPIVKDQVATKLEGMGVESKVAQIIATCLWVRREEIRAQLVRDSCSISHSYLNDFDWRLRLVMSSDKLGSIQKPVVSLDFSITENGEQKQENIELSKEELEKFIASLEAANKVVAQLRT